MPVLYVLDVAEFAPLVQTCQAQARISSGSGYIAVIADQDLVIERSATGLCEAIWFGALTGGFDGRILRFDDQVLHLTQDDR